MPSSHDLACFADGACVAVVEGTDSCGVATRTTAAGGWTSIRKLGEGKRCSRPKLACSEPNGARTCVLVFAETGQGGVSVARSTDGGLAWSNAIRLDPQEDLNSGPNLDWDIACSLQDHCVISALVEPGNRTVQWRSMDSSNSWQGPQHGVQNEMRPLQVDSACSPSGTTCARAFVATTVGTAPGQLVYTQRSADLGRSWSQPAPLALSKQSAAIAATSRRFNDVAVACPSSTVCHVLTTASANGSAVASVEVSTSTDGGLSFSPLQTLQAGQKPATACSVDGTKCVAVWRANVAQAAYSFWAPSTGWQAPVDISQPPEMKRLTAVAGPRVQFTRPDAVLTFLDPQGIREMRASDSAASPRADLLKLVRQPWFAPAVVGGAVVLSLCGVGTICLVRRCRKPRTAPPETLSVVPKRHSSGSLHTASVSVTSSNPLSSRGTENTETAGPRIPPRTRLAPRWRDSGLLLVGTGFETTLPRATTSANRAPAGRAPAGRTPPFMGFRAVSITSPDVNGV